MSLFIHIFVISNKSKIKPKPMSYNIEIRELVKSTHKKFVDFINRYDLFDTNITVKHNIFYCKEIPINHNIYLEDYLSYIITYQKDNNLGYVDKLETFKKCLLNDDVDKAKNILNGYFNYLENNILEFTKTVRDDSIPNTLFILFSGCIPFKDKYTKIGFGAVSNSNIMKIFRELSLLTDKAKQSEIDDAYNFLNNINKIIEITDSVANYIENMYESKNALSFYEYIIDKVKDMEFKTKMVEVVEIV